MPAPLHPLLAHALVTGFALLVHALLLWMAVRPRGPAVAPLNRPVTFRFIAVHCVMMVGLLNCMLLMRRDDGMVDHTFQVAGLGFGAGLFASLLWWMNRSRKLQQHESHRD